MTINVVKNVYVYIAPDLLNIDGGMSNLDYVSRLRNTVPFTSDRQH